MFADLQNLFTVIEEGDPLCIQEEQKKELSDSLKLGVKAIEGHVFRPTQISLPIIDGHTQTILMGLKGILSTSEYEYDKRMTFALKDGGQVYLDMKGKCFLDETVVEQDRPLLFVLPGLTSTSQALYVRNLVEEAHSRDFDVVCMNQRGLAGCPLTTPKLYKVDQYDDALEAMQHFYDKFCKGKNKKFMAIGCSMGANILVHLLGNEGENSFIDAACCVQAPMKLLEILKTIRVVNGGFYDRSLGAAMKGVMRDNEPQMREKLKNDHNIDILKSLDKMDDSIIDYDTLFTVKMFGYKDVEEYYDKASCVHQIPNIKKPTLFLSALDDPIIGPKGIDHESCAQNQYTVLATNKHGGHMAYNESFLESTQWYLEPAFDYLNILKY